MPQLRGGLHQNDETAYLVDVTSSYCKEVGEKNTPLVEVHFLDPESGGTAKKSLWLTEKAFEHTAKALALMGWDPQEKGYRFEELDTGFDTPIKGAHVEIVVIEELEYNGDRVFPQVKWINDPDGGGGVPQERMQAGEAKTFADRVRKSLGVDARTQRVKTAVQDHADAHKPPAEDYDFDDIPF